MPQILTNRSEGFIKLAKALKDWGYEEINLNLGCPSKTVVTKGKGSGFLAKPEELERFLTEIFDVESVESFLEFIFIVMYCGYTLCCASAVDSDDGKIKPLLSFFALSLFSVSIAFSLARILMILSGNYEDLSRVTFSALTYLFIGLFALNCELSVFITENVSKD